ncbi:hypothetical protein [Bacillus sp. REN16]|uniref:hypothetical protein n=1 Tax=Bacillus sp. REN16 TaxID=2887296 RepID=UPI001E4E4487|nr:hypothetical protein [Bacillus sp. REN16]MCC3358945.1 hypothetical protein [Bacillus sp. REN16]
MENSLSEKKIKVYQRVWHEFETWCQDHQISEPPASPETMVRYITVLSEYNQSATIKKKLTAISQAYKTVGLPSPLEHEIVRKSFRGIQKELGTEQTRKNPLLLEDLYKISDVVPITKTGLRDWTILLMFCRSTQTLGTCYHSS